MNYTEEQMMEIARKFDVGDSISEIKPLGPGFINDTFVIKTGGEHPALPYGGASDRLQAGE